MPDSRLWDSCAQFYPIHSVPERAGILPISIHRWGNWGLGRLSIIWKVREKLAAKLGFRLWAVSWAAWGCYITISCAFSSDFIFILTHLADTAVARYWLAHTGLVLRFLAVSKHRATRWPVTCLFASEAGQEFRLNVKHSIYVTFLVQQSGLYVPL